MTQRAFTAVQLLGDRGITISTVDPRLAIFLLLDGAQPAALRDFVDLVLGPLLAYDTTRGNALLSTIEAYLACGGQGETTARALNIHASTLKYRIRRIFEVGGLDLRNADHRFNAALAMRIRSLVTD
jgi:DNA-binding PucR family transcriptional regulator